MKYRDIVILKEKRQNEIYHADTNQYGAEISILVIENEERYPGIMWDILTTQFTAKVTIMFSNLTLQHSCKELAPYIPLC